MEMKLDWPIVMNVLKTHLMRIPVPLHQMLAFHVLVLQAVILVRELKENVYNVIHQWDLMQMEIVLIVQINNIGKMEHVIKSI